MLSGDSATVGMASGEGAIAPLPWPLQADSASGLQEAAASLLREVDGRSALDVARQLAAERPELEHRAVVLGEDAESLTAGLASLAEGEPSRAVVSGRTGTGATAFMFTGQGAQRAGMGAELHEAIPPFARALDDACGALDEHLDRPLQDLLFAEKGSPEAALLDRTEYTQAALFAIEVALFRLVELLGVEPDFLIGHSIGELTAAHAAGVLSLEDAAALVAARGRLMGALPEGGAMVSARAGEAEVLATLEGFRPRLDIAAVNSPEAVVVSGDEDAAEQWAALLRDRDCKTTRLRVSHAFHSHHMEPMLDDFRAVAGSVSYAPPAIPIVSNLTGALASPEDLASPDHWVRHVREAVRFADGVRFLEAAGVTRYLELGPHLVLATLAQATLERDDALVVGALRGKRAERAPLMTFLATAHVNGVDVDWAPLLGAPA